MVERRMWEGIDLRGESKRVRGVRRDTWMETKENVWERLEIKYFKKRIYMRI